MATTETFARLPEPWNGWLPDMLDSPLPGESLADCENCVMCADPQRLPTRTLFDPVTRCCTYRPRLSNFMTGRLLLSRTTEADFGRISLCDRIDQGEAGLLGIMTDPAYQTIYGHARGVAFGQARSLRCPHQKDNAGCGIRDFRPPVCFTWFCKYERGATGQALWRGVFETLALAERAVSLWCLAQMGIGSRQRIGALEELNPAFSAARIDHRRDERCERETWGEWYGRETEFYIRCAEQVAELEWRDVLEIGGHELELRAENARALGGRHADRALPETLRAAEFQLSHALDGKIWLTGYNAYDPLEAEPDLVAFIARCDGRPLENVISGHVRAGGRRPDRMILRTLLDMGILAPGTDALPR